ncbi:MAG: endonuclease/exonuclease/phosphatase family protein [Cyanobacteriota bacterium]
MKIATWNLERPKLKGWKKNPKIQEQIDEIKADIWILTETNSVIHPENDSSSPNNYEEIATPPISDYHNPGENCSTIWSRYPIKRTFLTFDHSMAVCAEILSPLGNFLVYGTIITWANDKGPTGTSRKWQEHYKSIASHAQDWAKLNQGLPLCVAGDFNQTLSGPTGYGTRQGRKIVE